MSLSLQYDVVIIGAGPAGTSCALALEDSGLKVLLLDRSVFPRDKVCGDFVAAKCIRELDKITPGFSQRLNALDTRVVNRSTQFYVGDLKPIQFDWVLDSYNVKREHFDNELMQCVRESGKTDIKEGCLVKDLIRTEDGFDIECNDGTKVQTRFVIGADGAHSIVAKNLADFKVDHKHYGGSVRAYFSNVKNIEPAINEVYAHRDVMPGYFWLFPISETEANVGLGMHSSYITRKGIKLREVFFDFIESSPELRSKLGDAKMEGKLKGFGLPFYSKKHLVSGERYLLCGDAASMIDPINGEGIWPAIKSGAMAAEQVVSCFERQTFDADVTQEYAEAMHREFWNEMRIKAWLVRNFADKSRLLNIAARIGLSSPYLKKKFQQLM